VAATAALAVVAAEEEQLDAELAATRAALEGCREVERASALMVVRRRGGSGTLVRGGGGGGGGGCYLMRAPAVAVPAPGKQRCGDAASGRRRARPDFCQRDCTAAGVQPAAASSLSCATRRCAAVPPFLRVRVKIMGSQKDENVFRGISATCYHERSDCLHPHPYSCHASQPAA
jgi:hypothetical protein